MSKKKVSKLTQAQKDKFPEYVDKWTKIGLSTEPMDFPAACAAMTDAYIMVGLKPPAHFFPAPSPTAALKLRAKLGGGKPSDFVNDFIYGQHDVNWLAFYSFMGTELGIRQCEKLEPLNRLAQLAGWVLPYENACIISDRPREIHRDAQGRLHCEAGPAFLYRDGWGDFFYHGTRIPAEWGNLPYGQWEPKWLLKENNSELKRILIQAIGYSRIMYKLGSELIHSDGDMELRRIKADVDMEPIVLLKVVCPSTGAFYALRVDPSMTDCETARRSTFQMGKNEKFTQET